MSQTQGVSGLSPYLMDSYMRYKRDTKAFTHWLCTTARSTGFISNDFQDSPNSHQSSNAGGKRKKSHKSRKQPVTYRISTNRLIVLATAIKDAGAHKVPHHFLTVLKDIIKARKDCSDWYRTRLTDRSSVTRGHKDGHQHIIETLEEVYNVLSPLEETLPQEIPAAERSAVTQMANIFSSLNIEDCPDWNNKDINTPTQTSKAKQDSYEAEDLSDDTSFAIYCFMKDITDIRIFIRRTWREYRHGYITVNSAAVISNTALDTIYLLNTRFVEDFPQFAEHTAMIEYMFSDLIDSHDEGSEAVADEHYGSYSEGNIRLSRKAFFCERTANLVKEFYALCDIPIYEEGYEQKKDLFEEECTLLKCLSYLHVLDSLPTDSDMGKPTFPDDQLTNATYTMRLDKIFPTWVILACQVFIDIQRELGEEIKQGFESVRKEGIWLCRSWTGFLKAAEDTFSNPLPEMIPSVNKHIRFWELYTQQDRIQELVDMYIADNLDVCELNNSGSFFLLKNHPIMCGQILQDQLIANQTLSTCLANSQTYMAMIMHLNHAVALSGYLLGNSQINRAWADLEYIIEKHGDTHIFVGERPTMPIDCLTRMALFYGFPLNHWAQNKRKTSNAGLVANKKVRKLYMTSRYVDIATGCGLDSIRASRARREPSVMMELLVNRFINSKDTSCPANPSNEMDTKQTHNMSVLQCLTVYKKVLKEDDFPLRFNLLGLNQRCTKLLRDIKNTVTEQLQHTDPEGEKTSLCSLVVMLLADIRDVASNPVNRPKFGKAYSLLAEIAERQGNLEYLMATERVGVKAGTAVNPIDDPEDFEDPVRSSDSVTERE